MKIRLVVIAVALATFLSHGSATSAGESAPSKPTGSLSSTLTTTDASLAELPPGRYIVALKTGVDVHAAAKRHGVRPLFQFESSFTGYVGILDASALRAVRSDSSVEGVVPDQLVSTPRLSSEELFALVRRLQLPQVPAIDQLASLVVMPIYWDFQQLPTQVTPLNMHRIGLPLSPSAAVDGAGPDADVDIAVLDTGVDSDHPDLNVAGGYDCGTFGLSSWEDRSGHGTHVSGIAGARDNAYGVVGVAPGARIWAIKLSIDEITVTLASILCGVEWAVAHSDAIDVVNMSFGGMGVDDGNCGRTTPDLFHEAICRGRDGGLVFVTSAGNLRQDTTTQPPANYDEVIAVSGIADSDGTPGGSGPANCHGEPDDHFDAYSGYGPDIDIAAPSECILSTVPGGYGLMTGTSMASPHVAGAAALLVASGSAGDIRSQILAAAEPGPIAGDPDRTPEGVLNVSAF